MHSKFVFNESFFKSSFNSSVVNDLVSCLAIPSSLNSWLTWRFWVKDLTNCADSTADCSIPSSIRLVEIPIASNVWFPVCSIDSIVCWPIDSIAARVSFFALSTSSIILFASYKYKWKILYLHALLFKHFQWKYG